MVGGVPSVSGSRALEVLSEEDCWRLLSRDTVGRLACTRKALPAIVPVNYALRGEEVLIRTDSRSELGRSIDGSVVAFEVDQIDRQTHTGWSVMVVGRATALDLTGRPPQPALVGLEPWAEGEREMLVRIEVGQLSGRRLTAPPSTAPGGSWWSGVRRRRAAV